MRDPDEDRVQALVEPGRLRVDSPQERFSVRYRWRPGEHRERGDLAGQPAKEPSTDGAGQEAEQATEREPRDPVDGLGVVRVAVQDAAERRRAQRERDA